jgi:hypothetical protein
VPLFFSLVFLLFLIANRGAHQGYFFGDDLDNLRNARTIPAADLALRLASPLLDAANFRPLGALFYKATHALAGLRFGTYLSFLHLLHFANIALVYLLLRDLRASRFMACAGAFFFAFHPAVFDVYWKPLYVYDLLCGTAVLASLLLYVRGRLWWSVAAFFLAFKAKEVAILLPLALLAWERLLGENRWKRLWPFFLISLSFGLQALWHHAGRTDDYALHAGGLFRTTGFYATRLFQAPWAGLALLAAYFLKDPRVRFSVLLFATLLAPLLLLAGRMSGAYLYVPLIGASAALTFLIRGKWGVAAATAALALWMPFSYLKLRDYRRATLTLAQENRGWIAAAAAFTREHPAVRTFVYARFPQGLEAHGVSAALFHLRNGQPFELLDAEDAAAMARIGRAEELAALSWFAPQRKLSVIHRKANAPDASYLNMDLETPFWQLGEGWFLPEGEFRWTRPRARVRLFRPPDTGALEMRVNISPLHLEKVPQIELIVDLDGEPTGFYTFTRNGWKTLRWPLAPAPAGPVDVQIRVRPAFRPDGPDGVALGIPVGAIGFIARR